MALQRWPCLVLLGRSQPISARSLPQTLKHGDARVFCCFGRACSDGCVWRFGLRVLVFLVFQESREWLVGAWCSTPLWPLRILKAKKPGTPNAPNLLSAQRRHNPINESSQSYKPLREREAPKPKPSAEARWKGRTRTSKMANCTEAGLAALRGNSRVQAGLECTKRGFRTFGDLGVGGGELRRGRLRMRSILRRFRCIGLRPAENLVALNPRPTPLALALPGFSWPRRGPLRQLRSCSAWFAFEF